MFAEFDERTIQQGIAYAIRHGIPDDQLDEEIDRISETISRDEIDRKILLKAAREGRRQNAAGVRDRNRTLVRRQNRDAKTRR